ncbi:hypothetical protein GFO_3405 [Christiangramia forsetii KT0803]|uniref:Uncharacterized protein n=1 Tax=Christiangramia forsetii (strain DSM 17595 / CGMCC 1.15422 / KT0803) TaxID=411154 RepID=A0M6V0_CHRFK|nr:hypothetical protein GFO_3405 [Christiangramia forsetii KT0803]
MILKMERIELQRYEYALRSYNKKSLISSLFIWI